MNYLSELIAAITFLDVLTAVGVFAACFILILCLLAVLCGQIISPDMDERDYRKGDEG